MASAIIGFVISIALVSFLLIVPNSVEAESIVIHPPIITKVVNTPQSPPPGFSVNVTASVSSFPRSIAQVRLIFSSSSNPMNRTTEMVLVAGNSTMGLFFGTIPSNTNVNGVTVTYVVVATDSSGFEGVSEPTTYVVQPDHTSPAFTEEHTPVSYLGTTILNFTEVEVSFNATDSGSGVRRVFVLYSNSTDPNHNLTEEIDLNLAEGDRFDGLWSGFVPPMSNGTVIYKAEALDFSGNIGDSSLPFGRGSYQINPMSAFLPNADIQLVVQNLNLTTRMLTVYFVITSNLPGRYAGANFTAEVDIKQPSYDSLSVIVPRLNGFFYQRPYTMEIPIHDVNLWPFDSYSIDIAFDLYAPYLNANNTKGQFLLTDLAFLQFDNSTPSIGTTVTMYGTQVTFHVELTRKPSLIDPVMQAIYAVFFVLGSVALIRPSNVSRRLELFLGLFTFIVILFYTITPILQSEGASKIIGPTVPQALLIGLTWSVTPLMGASLAIAYLRQTGWFPETVRTYRIVFRQAFNFGLASLALAVTWNFSGIFVGFQYNYYSLELPQVWNAVVCGLFLPPIVTLILDLASSRRMVTQILRASTHRGLHRLRRLYGRLSQMIVGLSSNLVKVATVVPGMMKRQNRN